MILVFGGLIFGLTAYLQIGSDFSTSRNFLIIVAPDGCGNLRTAISLSQISEEEKEIQLRKNRPILKPGRVPHYLEITFRAVASVEYHPLNPNLPRFYLLPPGRRIVCHVRGSHIPHSEFTRKD